MSLIVETGANVAGAESYASVADATTYIALRGDERWATMSNAEMEEALRRATDYMQQTYRGRWKGFRVSSTQTLDWPRQGVQVEDDPYGSVVAITTVPAEVVAACIQYALKAAAGDLSPDVERAKLSESVGPISVTYDSNASQVTQYRAQDALLRRYLTGGAFNARVMRG